MGIVESRHRRTVIPSRSSGPAGFGIGGFLDSTGLLGSVGCLWDANTLALFLIFFPSFSPTELRRMKPNRPEFLFSSAFLSYKQKKNMLKNERND